MTVQCFSAGTPHNRFILVDAVMSIIVVFSTRLATRRRYRTVRNELLGYAPDQLAELGICEADIEFVAEAAVRP